MKTISILAPIGLISVKKTIPLLKVGKHGKPREPFTPIFMSPHRWGNYSSDLYGSVVIYLVMYSNCTTFAF